MSCPIFSCFFFSLLLLRTPRSEGTNQAPITTASTYSKHSTAACNRPCTEQQRTYSNARVDQTAVCDNASQQTRDKSILPRASMYVPVVYVLFFSFCSFEWNAY